MIRNSIDKPTYFHKDYRPTDECSNLDTYGCICVKCGRCGRRFDQNGNLMIPSLLRILTKFFDLN